MNHKTICLKLSWLAAALLLSSCSSDKETVTYESREEVIVTPGFLSGAAGVLLVNPEGFSAQVRMEPPVPSAKAHVVSGLLLGQGGRLLFSPTGGDRTFIWDVYNHTGWIYSEALQGYAPLTSAEQFTNVALISESAGSTSTRVNGHPGHDAEISVSSSFGSTLKFSVWRASDLNNLPVRIVCLDAAHPATIQLSDAHREKLDAKLFQPPEGFTKYASAESIASEIFSRKARMRAQPNTIVPGNPVAPQGQSPSRPY